MNYAGKVAIVTGASSGIGRETALALARRGAIVVGTARREALLAELLRECQAYSPQSIIFPGDLADPAFPQRLVSETARRLGRLDILVNNAALPFHKQIYDVGPAEPEAILRVNFLAAASASLEAIPHMLLAGGGAIVNVSSFATRVAPPRESLYTASKCALDGFTRALWTDLAGSGIHASLIVPGPIDTEIWEKDDSPSGYRGGKHPPSIVADAILSAIDSKHREVIVPRWSPQLVAARVLATVAPGALLAGMARMEPVPAEVIEQARSAAQSKARDA